MFLLRLELIAPARPPQRGLLNKRTISVNRFSDPRAADLWSTRVCAALPTAAVEPAYRLIRLLLVSRSWADVRVFTQVARLPDGRYVAPAHGKWGVAFEWLDGLGATRLSLERF